MYAPIQTWFHFLSKQHPWPNTVITVKLSVTIAVYLYFLPISLSVDSLSSCASYCRSPDSTCLPVPSCLSITLHLSAHLSVYLCVLMVKCICLSAHPPVYSWDKPFLNRGESDFCSYQLLCLSTCLTICVHLPIHLSICLPIFLFSVSSCPTAHMSVWPQVACLPTCLSVWVCWSVRPHACLLILTVTRLETSFRQLLINKILNKQGKITRITPFCAGIHHAKPSEWAVTVETITFRDEPHYCQACRKLIGTFWSIQNLNLEVEFNRRHINQQFNNFHESWNKFVYFSAPVCVCGILDDIRVSPGI